jgi:hypothetical protein
MRGPDDGSVRFMRNINQLQCGVCKSCARRPFAVVRASAMERDESLTHARIVARKRSQYLHSKRVYI